MENFFVFSEKQEKLSIVWTGEVIYKFPALEVKTWSHGLLGHVHLLRLCLDHGIGVFSGEVIQAGAQFILFYPCPQRCVAPDGILDTKKKKKKNPYISFLGRIKKTPFAIL